MKNLLKAKKIAESNRNSISDWLKKAAEIRKIEPYAQRALDVVSWQLESLNKIPSNAPDIKPELVETMYFSGEVFSKRLPEITIQTDLPVVMSVVPGSANSGSSMTFEYLNEIYPQISPEEQKEILPQINSYKLIYENQERYGRVKDKLRDMKPYLKDDLETASKELQHYRNGTAEVLSPEGFRDVH